MPQTNTGPIAWFARNPVAANLLMVLILVLGLMAAVSTRIEGFPSFEPNTISIDVAYPSGSAKQAEEGIAIKIEKALETVVGIKEIRSNSDANGASITVEKNSGYSLSALTRDVKNQVDGIYGFPRDAEKPVIKQQQEEDHVLWLSFYGEADRHSLQSTALNFEQELLDKTDVSQVQRGGWRKPEIAIEIDEQTLQAYSLSLAAIRNQLAKESFAQTSGELRSAEGLVLLRAARQAYSQTEFEQLVLRRDNDGSEIRLGDIAKVYDSFEETPRVLSRFKGKPSVTLKVVADSEGDVINIAKQSRSLVQQWQQQGRLPANIQLNLWWDQSQLMQARLGLLAKNGLFGVALVMLILSIFLNLRVAFWVGMGLPICFSGALLLMGESFFDLTLNELTSFGFIVVLGILVDDAVVVGESIYSSREQHGDNIEATIKGVQTVAIPTLFGVLTTIAAFYPMSFIAGELGSIFSQFALVAVACLVFSMVESKLILPAHLAHIDTRTKSHKNPIARLFGQLQERANRFIRWLDLRVYQPGLHQALKFRYSVLMIFIAIFILVIGMVLSGQVRAVFFPNIPSTIFEVQYNAETGSGYGLSHQQSYRIEKIVTQFNQQWRQQFNIDKDLIIHSQTEVNDGLNGTAVLELDKDTSDYLSNGEILHQLRQALGKPEGFRSFQISSEFGDIDDFNLKVLAPDRELLEIINDKILSALAEINGVSDIQSDLSSGQTQLQFALNAEGRSLGLSSADLALQIQQAFYGAEVQRIQRGKEEVKVRVRYPAQQRRDISNLKEARIRLNNGDIVPLSTVAHIFSAANINSIQHVNGRLSATIIAATDKAVISPEALMAQLQAELLEDLAQQYPSVEFLEGGEISEKNDAQTSMVKVFTISLIAIYALVAIPLKSYWQPLIIMSVIPFGIVGAILGHWISDLSISLLSLNGILALSGVVVNDSLLLLSRFNQLSKEEGLHQAIVNAGSQRLRAILLTSITTYAGLATLLQETSEQAQYLIPAAASLAYGILFATFITLVLIPILLAISADIRALFSQPGEVSNAPV